MKKPAKSKPTAPAARKRVSRVKATGASAARKVVARASTPRKAAAKATPTRKAAAKATPTREVAAKATPKKVAARTASARLAPPAAQGAGPAVTKAPRSRAARVEPRKFSTGPVLMPLHDGVVYGPVRSRRLGRSLGVNLLPAHLKLCTFNCSYCQYGWSANTHRGTDLENWPSPQTVVRAVGTALRTLAAEGEHIDRLTLAGHGEPTLHPQFPEIMGALRRLRDEIAPSVPIAVLSNASTLNRLEIRTALAQADERYMKLDAGDAATLRNVNASSLPFEQLIGGLQSLPDIVVQAMFVKDRTGRIDNTGDLTVISWINALQRIKPRAVHIYTLDRAPAWPYLQPVPGVRLREIAQRVRLAGLECELFGVPGEDEVAAAR